MDPSKKDLELGAAPAGAVVYAEVVPAQPHGAYPPATVPGYVNYAYNPAVVPQQQQTQHQPQQGQVVMLAAPQQAPVVMVVQQPTVVQPMPGGFASPGSAPGQQLLSLNPQGGNGQAQLQYNQPAGQQYEHRGLNRKLGGWSSGLCDCLSQLLPTCFLAWFCSCFLLGRTSHQAGTRSYQCVLGTFCCSLCCQVVLSCCALPIPLVWIVSVFFNTEARSKIRQRFQIPGSWCEDFVCSACCYPCALSQMARQINDYSRSLDCENCDIGVPYGQSI